MPDGLTRVDVDLSPEEQRAFRKWLAPIKAVLRRHKLPAKSDAFYLQEWLDIGKPGYIEPHEKRAEIGEGPYLVADYPAVEDLYKLGEGFEWVKVTSDPTTGTPIQPQWISQPITEEPTEFQPTDEEVAQAWRIAAGLEPPVSDEELTPWQLAQIERWEAERGVEEERFEWQVSEAALARGQSQRERELADRLRLQQELAGLGGPADWIKRWQMIHGVIPRAEATRMRERSWSLLTESQDLTGAERLAKEQQAASLEWGAQRLLTQTRGLPEAPGFYYSPMKEWTPAELEEAQAYEATLQAGEVTPMPPTPEWLPQFAESQVAGEPITKGRTTTPSGQQWTQTPWSVREGLRGYTEFAGFRPYQDILEHMAQMAPRTPVGAGRTQWKPAQQRA